MAPVRSSKMFDGTKRTSMSARPSASMPVKRSVRTSARSSSRAPWVRPDELPPALLDSVRGELDGWRCRRRRPIRNASVLVRAEHGYRMTFRTPTEQVTIELALAPPRIAHEERCPILEPKRTLLGSLRTLFNGGAAPSRSRASGGA